MRDFDSEDANFPGFNLVLGPGESTTHEWFGDFQTWDQGSLSREEAAAGLTWDIQPFTSADRYSWQISLEDTVAPYVCGSDNSHDASQRPLTVVP